MTGSDSTSSTTSTSRSRSDRDSNRDFDVVVWGASGFTGRLVAQHLLGRHGAGGALRWALGGRDSAKLEKVRREICQAAGAETEALPIVLGDGDDEASLASLAERTVVVCTTVGPYTRYGSKLVAACARAGTHYCDLTGEIQWMRQMIDRHQAEAEASGARIVHACGFDSIPSDLGVWFLQQEMQARHGVPCPRVRYRVRGFSGGVSGGTAASMLAMLEDASDDPSIRQIMANPYALDPDPKRGGPDGPEAMAPVWDDAFGQWTGPFVMAACNTRVVRRTNALLGFPYGEAFRYDEATLTGGGVGGWLKAAGLAAGLGVGMGVMRFGSMRRVIGGRLPSPGEGPSKERREQGFFDIGLHAEHPDDPGKGLRARVRGDRDPGYGSTSKMLGEVAVCLAIDELPVGGGLWTPASAMGRALLTRLETHAGLSFRVEE
jgi:short subunit dehydrogenase-like uncharacterized protein